MANLKTKPADIFDRLRAMNPPRPAQHRSGGRPLVALDTFTTPGPEGREVRVLAFNPPDLRPFSIGPAGYAKVLAAGDKAITVAEAVEALGLSLASGLTAKRVRFLLDVATQAAVDALLK